MRKQTYQVISRVNNGDKAIICSCDGRGTAELIAYLLREHTSKVKDTNIRQYTVEVKK